ncbi:hypothetical protein YC2023_064318 [Brassica napus]
MFVPETKKIINQFSRCILVLSGRFEVQYPDEHITSVEGSYNKVGLYATEVITSLVFKTSKGRTSPKFGPNLFGVVNGAKFFLRTMERRSLVFMDARVMLSTLLEYTLKWTL